MPGTRKLGKPTDQRMAMLRQQVTDLLTYGKITTTVTRAKEVKPLAETMITLGKKNTLASRRQALAFMTKEDAVTRVSTLRPLHAGAGSSAGGESDIVVSLLRSRLSPGGTLPQDGGDQGAVRRTPARIGGADGAE